MGQLSKDDTAHLSNCNVRACRRCAYLRNAEEWRRKTLISNSDVSYLRSEITPEGKWRVFCWICRKVHGADGKGLAAGVEPAHINNVTRHSQFQCHVDALFELGLARARDLDAPPATGFMEVAKHCQNGNPWCQGVAGVGGRKKVSSMMTCLAQALFRDDQVFMQSAASIMLHSDVRGSRLAIRFRASNASLDSRTGLLGVARVASHSAMHIKEGFLKVLAEFCKRAGAVDYKLVARILHRTEILDGDAASDGQLAMSLLRSSGLFPSIKCIVKDPCHASRRVIKRPWSVIDEIKEAFVKVIAGRRSLTNIIQNSETLAKVFSDFADRSLDCPVVGAQAKNLSRRAHRFDSYQKPLARFCLYVSAFFETASWIQVNRQSDKEQFETANSFLHWVTPSKLLVLAMCADAADESLLLTRHFDSEGHDLAALHAAAESYVTRLKYLFLEGHVLRATGFTSHMLKWLGKTRAVKVGKRVKCIGGAGVVTPQLTEDSLKPMKVFVHMACQTIDAEYPAFGILGAFACFDVQPSKLERDMAAQEVHLRRLAQVLNLSFEELDMQFGDHLAIALHEAKQQRLDNAAAWVAAVKKTSSAQKAVRLKHPCHILIEVLVRYVAWQGCSTSGVEQFFSHGQHQIDSSRNHFTEGNEVCELKVMSDFRHRDATNVCTIARTVWTELFAAPRKSSADRLDAGVPRPKKQDSEIAFLRKRRLEAGGADSKASVQAVIAESQPYITAGLTDSIQNELLFQEKKKFKNRLLAYLDEALLQSELTPDMAQLAQAYLDHRAKLDRDRQKAEKRKFSLMSPDLPNLDSQPILLESMMWLNMDCLRGKQVVADATDAAIFVVEKLDCPHLTTRWAVGLRGGHVVDLDFLKSGGSKGVCVSYDPAIAIQRKVYLCPLFRRENPNFATIVVQASMLRHSKWTLLSSWEDFFYYRKSQGLQCIALTTRASQNIVAGKDVVNASEFQDKFLSKLAIVSRNLCAKQRRRG